MALTVTDNNNLQSTYTTTSTIMTLDCLNIFDRDTKLSWVTMDLDYQRSGGDIFFNFDYSECGSYYFDPNLMTFNYDIYSRPFIPTDIDLSNKRFKIRQEIQWQLPLNDYFYVRVKGQWRSRDMPEIFELNLVYQLRFITKFVV